MPDFSSQDLEVKVSTSTFTALVENSSGHGRPSKRNQSIGEKKNDPDRSNSSEVQVSVSNQSRSSTTLRGKRKKGHDNCAHRTDSDSPSDSSPRTKSKKNRTDEEAVYYSDEEYMYKNGKPYISKFKEDSMIIMGVRYPNIYRDERRRILRWSPSFKLDAEGSNFISWEADICNGLTRFGLWQFVDKRCENKMVLNALSVILLDIAEALVHNCDESITERISLRINRDEYWFNPAHARMEAIRNLFWHITVDRTANQRYLQDLHMNQLFTSFQSRNIDGLLRECTMFVDECMKFPQIWDPKSIAVLLVGKLYQVSPTAGDSLALRTCYLDEWRSKNHKFTMKDLLKDLQGIKTD